MNKINKLGNCLLDARAKCASIIVGNANLNLDNLEGVMRRVDEAIKLLEELDNETR